MFSCCRNSDKVAAISNAYSVEVIKKQKEHFVKHHPLTIATNGYFRTAVFFSLIQNICALACFVFGLVLILNLESHIGFYEHFDDKLLESMHLQEKGASDILSFVLSDTLSYETSYNASKLQIATLLAHNDQAEQLFDSVLTFQLQALVSMASNDQVTARSTLESPTYISSRNSFYSFLSVAVDTSQEVNLKDTNSQISMWTTGQSIAIVLVVLLVVAIPAIYALDRMRSVWSRICRKETKKLQDEVLLLEEEDRSNLNSRLRNRSRVSIPNQNNSEEQANVLDSTFEYLNDVISTRKRLSRQRKQNEYSLCGTPLSKGLKHIKRSSLVSSGQNSSAQTATVGIPPSPPAALRKSTSVRELHPPMQKVSDILQIFLKRFFICCISLLILLCVILINVLIFILQMNSTNNSRTNQLEDINHLMFGRYHYEYVVGHASHAILTANSSYFANDSVIHTEAIVSEIAGIQFSDEHQSTVTLNDADTAAQLLFSGSDTAVSSGSNTTVINYLLSSEFTGACSIIDSFLNDAALYSSINTDIASSHDRFAILLIAFGSALIVIAVIVTIIAIWGSYRSFVLAERAQLCQTWSLIAILCESGASELLLQYCQDNFCDEQYLFWNRVDALFSNCVNDGLDLDVPADRSSMLARLAPILDEFLRKTGQKPINVSQELRESIVILYDNRSPEYMVVDEFEKLFIRLEAAQKECFDLMMFNNYRPFLRSRAFKRYAKLHSRGLLERTVLLALRRTSAFDSKHSRVKRKSRRDPVNKQASDGKLGGDSEEHKQRLLNGQTKTNRDNSIMDAMQ